LTEGAFLLLQRLGESPGLRQSRTTDRTEARRSPDLELGAHP
jgi:hypothetical protein